MIILNVDQQSSEWFSAKAGLPSASNFKKIIQINGTPSKTRDIYMQQLAGEKITGLHEETYQNIAMLKGCTKEIEGRQLYGILHDIEVQQVGLCYPDEKKLYGCSPDGLIGEEGMLEIKCPLISTHVGYLLNNVLPSTYFQQVQGQLFVTGRKWVDFFSYYPGLKPFIIREKRNKKFIDSLKIELNLFCEELAEMVKKIGG
ncbi:MAG: YqaJ viral recombinase family protein [Nanoarchaeota archaeon]|nr:YqaJ viral recombinase family protein [Nanoarchaeota archaeon]